MADEADEDAFRLTRNMGDRGPSLAEKLSERLDRLSFASPFHRMRLKGRFPLKLIAVPEDPIPGDAGLGQRLKGGRLYRDGYGQGMAEARLDAPDAPEAWRDWVHGWGWLRDLSSVGPLSAAEAARAEALAKRWLARFHDYDEEAWAPAATGRRILMTISYAPLVMPGHDHIHRSAVLNGVARWGRHLDRAVPRMPVGFARAEAATGLMGCALMLPGDEERMARADALLAETVGQLMPDEGGSSASRSPLDLARIGDLMLQLAAFHRARSQKPSATVAATLERVRAGLSALAMGDGLPSPWHGGQPDRAQMARLEATPAEAPPARRTGYIRLDAGTTRLMVDAGPPPPVRLCPTAHASTLAVTITDGSRRLLVSCGAERGADGLHGFPPELAMGLRSTAGHSALVLADTNSSRLDDGGPRRLGGVDEVLVEFRATAQGQWFEGRHDGWRKRFGYDHVRRLWLNPAGDDLRGEDRLEPVRGGLAGPRQRAPLPFAIRFHLGPEAGATLTQDGRGALIRISATARGETDTAWGFRASFNNAPGLVAIEPSLLVEPDGSTREIQQLILTSLVDPGGTADVSWSFKRQGGAGR